MLVQFCDVKRVIDLFLIYLYSVLMMSNLRGNSGISFDCNESVISVQGLKNRFENLMINSVNKVDDGKVFSRNPPPIPPRLGKLPSVLPKNLPIVPPRNKIPPVLVIPLDPIIFQARPSDSEDSFGDDSFDEDEQTSKYSTKLKNIIQELIEKEKSYVDCLKTGMLNYMSALDTNELPLSLRGQKYRIFGNIQNFYEFHTNIFLPQIIKCSHDVERLAELFTSYIQRDSFYGYVLYALNRRKSELMCDEHVFFLGY